jgi:hypothetical protein
MYYCCHAVIRQIPAATSFPLVFAASEPDERKGPFPLDVQLTKQGTLTWFAGYLKTLYRFHVYGLGVHPELRLFTEF